MRFHTDFEEDDNDIKYDKETKAMKRFGYLKDGKIVIPKRDSDEY